MRRPLVLGLALAVLPTTAALAFVRPIVDPVYDRVGLTAIASGVRTDGIVGASGGLVTLDTGSAYVSASLDSSPSARVLASPVEPGTLTRTLVGQGNGAAGSAVFAVPDAEATSPGAQTKGRCCGAPSISQPPVTASGPYATADAGPVFARGTAGASGYDLAGALTSGPSSSTVTMTASAASGKVVQDATTSVSKLTVAGVLSVTDVVASAHLTADGDAHTAAQSLSIGGASVSGQAVELSNDGVTALGTPLVPGMTLEVATAQANAQLKQAGIAVHTVGGTAKHDGRSASAGTGGVEIHLVTPDLPGGVAANSLTIIVGGVALTEIDSPFLPSTPVGTGGGPAGGTPSGTTTTTTVIPGTPGAPAISGIPGEVGPQIAGPSAQLVTRSFLLGGRRVSYRMALIGFAAWQLLSLGSATLYAFVERRRRLILMGRRA